MIYQAALRNEMHQRLGVQRGVTLPSLHALLIALAVVLAWAVLPTGSASAAVPAVVQCNGTDNVGGGTVTCSVSATSTVTGTGTTTPSAGTSCGSQG